MSLEYYGIKVNPFSISPDTRFFFESRAHARVKSYMTFGIGQGEGFVIVTGEPGTGKTTLVAQILSRLDPSRLRCARIVPVAGEAEDVLQTVAASFGIPNAGSGSFAVGQAVGRFVAERGRAGERCLLVVDEAHTLDVAALERLRLLADLGMNGQPQLQVLLVGQPRLRRTLAEPEMELLRQRVVAACHLTPLGEDSIRDYVQHRLTQAGWHGDPELGDGVFPTLHRHSEGVPRRINLLCSRLLLLGMLDERHSLDEADVDQVADELAAETLEAMAP